MAQSAADIRAEARPEVDIPAEAHSDADVPAEACSEADVPAEACSEADVPAEAHPDRGGPAEACSEADVPAEAHPFGGGPAEAHPGRGGRAEAHPFGGGLAEAHPDGGVPAEARCEADVPAEARREADAQPGARAAKPTQIAARKTSVRQPPYRTSDRRPARGQNGPDLGDALVAMAESVLARGIGSRSGAERTQLFVHLRQRDIEAQGEPWRPLLHDGTLLSGDTFRRLACDAGLVVAHVDAAGHPLDVGRKTRTIRAALRRALWVRDGGCRFPGCGAQVFVDAHHVKHWCEGGGTSLDNTLLLCDHHHRAVHEEGFSVSLLNGVACFHDPRDRAIPVAPQPPHLRGNAMQSLAERHDRRGIAIEPRTNLPDWDGTPLDRGAAVGALIRKSPPPATMHH